jgi:uncharacterized protein YdhG (YjbR/CyaY superfamily)
MAKTNFKSVDEYIDSQPEAAQGVLERLRSTIRKAVPGASEVISYQRSRRRAADELGSWRFVREETAMIQR